MYLCIELEVRTHGVHDNLLRHSAFIADPEGEADAAPEPAEGHHMGRLQHFHHWLPIGLMVF